jgi:hypothetical protein
MYQQSNSDLVGVPQATLQQWLLQAQTAMNDLACGSKVVQAQYGQGDGNRMVTYKVGDMAMLRGYIQELKAALGLSHGRKPIVPFFTSDSGNRYDG